MTSGGCEKGARPQDRECTLTTPETVALLTAMIAPAPNLPPVVGEGYDYETIRTSLGGQSAPPYFVIHREGLIVGLCLGLMWNPLAENDPGEVWVGKKGDLARWGTKLAETTGPLPVYVRREEGGKWFYIGQREVTGSSTEPETIRARLKPPAITAISRIVYLKNYTSVLASESAPRPE